jgi:hypothetical protein
MAPGAVFTTLHFLRNLRMGTISESGLQHYSGKAWQRRTLQLIWGIRKLVKNNVLCTWPLGPYSQRFIFFITYEWAQ